MSDSAGLLNRYLSGTLSDAELTSFVARLKADAGLARAWREAMENDAMLREFGQGRMLSRLHAESSARSRRRRPPVRPATRVWGLLLASAAAVLFAIAVLMSSSPRTPSPVSAAPAPLPVETPAPKPPAPETVPPPPGVPRQTPSRPIKRVAPGEVQRGKEPPPKPVAPAPRKVTPRSTVAAVPAPMAKLEHVQGTVRRLRGGTESEAEEGGSLQAGDGIRVAAGNGSADIVFPDGTRVSLSGGARVESFRTDGPGKSVAFREGSLRAEVAKQPEKAPMKFTTGHGEATVLGTVLRILVDPDPRKGSMRTEVLEGRVRVRNRGARSVELRTGHFAVAGPGRRFVATPLPRTVAERLLLEKGSVTVNFGPDGMALPADVLNDSGEEFVAARGYGWTGANGTVAATGWAKRSPMARAAAPGVDILRTTHVGAGWADRVETWNLTIPNGRYLVTVGVGDPSSPEQGPHHVVVEGAVVVNARFTKAGEFLEPKDVPVRIQDEALTVSVGGHRSARSQSDGTSDTVLTFVTVKRIR